MNKILSLKILVATALGLIASAGAVAAPLNGDIKFQGSATLDAVAASATKITFNNDVEVNASGSTGDYAGIANGTSATFKELDFSSSEFVGNLAIDNLWTVEYSGTTYTFDLERITVNSVVGTTLIIEGFGTAESTDASQDDWVAAFQLSTSGSGTEINFSSTTEVPDSGTTAALLGLGMLGLAGAARRLKK